MIRAIAAAVSVILAVVPAAWAVEWPVLPTAMTTASENATLGVSGRPAAADSEGRVHLVYQRNLDGEMFQVYYTVRETNGTWSAPVLVSAPDASGRNATIAIDHEDRVHVLWEDLSALDGDIAHRVRETDGTWGPIESVSPAPGFSRHPVAAVDSADRLHAVWVDGRAVPQRILHAVLPPGGTWSAAELLSVGGDLPQTPSLAADAVGGIHAVWADRTLDPLNRSIWTIFYLRLGLGATGTPKPIKVVEPAGIAENPFVEAKDDGTVYVVWMDNRTSSHGDDYEVYLKRYLPSIGWGKDKRFSYSTFNHGNPIIVAGPQGRLNVAWEDYRTGNPDIYYREITPEIGWDRNEIALSSDLSSSQAPSLVALPNGQLFAFWTDSQGTGVFRIFTKEGNADLAP